MRRWRKSAGAAVAATLFIVAHSADISAAPCDEHDPAAPARSARIILGAGDFTGDERDELRSFVETGSLGPVEAAIISSSPRGVVRSFFATMNKVGIVDFSAAAIRALRM